MKTRQSIQPLCFYYRQMRERQDFGQLLCSQGQSKLQRTRCMPELLLCCLSLTFVTVQSSSRYRSTEWPSALMIRLSGSYLGKHWRTLGNCFYDSGSPYEPTRQVNTSQVREHVLANLFKLGLFHFHQLFIRSHQKSSRKSCCFRPVCFVHLQPDQDYPLVLDCPYTSPQCHINRVRPSCRLFSSFIAFLPQRVTDARRFPREKILHKFYLRWENFHKHKFVTEMPRRKVPSLYQ